MRFRSLFAMAAFCLIATQVNAQTDKLKVAAIFPMSGAQSTYGEESLNGIEMALEDLKKSDAALAAKIEVIKEDEKSSPIDAATAVKKVLSVDKVDVVFGSVASSNTLSMTSAVLEAKKILVTPSFYES